MLGVGPEVPLTDDWQWFALPIRVDSASSAARFDFALCNVDATIWLDDVAVHDGAHGVAWTRAYENGVVFVNPGDEDLVLTSDEDLLHIEGIRDRSVNDGSPVLSGASFVVPARDGLILLR